MKWLKNYLAERRERRRQENVAMEELREREEQEYIRRHDYVRGVESGLDGIVRYRFGVEQFNKVTGKEHEAIVPISEENLVRMRNIVYSSWETDWTAVNMEHAKIYRKLLDQGWVALVNYDRKERSGIPVRVKKV